MRDILAKDIDLLYISGLKKYKLQDYSGAIEDFNRAIDINSKHPWAYNTRGESKRKLNDFSGSIADYSVSIENCPNHTGG